MDETQAEGRRFLERLTQAVDGHDVATLVALFHSDYRNETPAHPDRGFVGNDQVARNWTQIFGLVPDIRQRVLRWTVDGDMVWAELEHTGTRRDGTPHAMAGVGIFGVRDGRAAWVRFYLEPVTTGTGPDDAVRQSLLGEVRS